MTSPSPQVSAVLARLRQVADGPLSAATAMPPEMYHSEEILHLEQQRMFAHDWVSPGLAAEIPEPGDYLTYSIADQPVFCMRGRDGEIRTFANVCRHRMMQLLDGSGNTGRIVCPYHAWSYDLDGRLAA
ncbi:MAG: Rieske (2Fe-2S) protein, partial [Acidimicrobiales bacterium]|nr:Rieske (2Fe-2S) protein [Acidimicrobiales bacterium]